jgi:ureidoglycolate lyase
MINRTIPVEDATPDSVAAFGAFVGVDPAAPVFAEWEGVTVLGPVPVVTGEDGELLHVRMQAARFPARVALLERHVHHTQTYLSANGRPFVMVLGAQTRAGLPDIAHLRAFLFKSGAGIVMKPGTWHEFPLALEDDTRFTVILSGRSHINQLDAPPHPADARGPDLERYDIAARADVRIAFAPVEPGLSVIPVR